MKKLSVATSFATLMLTSWGALATVSGVTTATADVTVAAPMPPVQLNITPTSNLIAKMYPTESVIAQATLTSSGGTSAIQWTSSVGTQGSAAGARTIVGKNNNSHKLALKLSLPTENWSDVDDGWFKTTKTGGLAIKVLTDGEQNIAADTYTISLDAGTYTE